MFSLGNKEAICNSSAKYPVTITGTTMQIKGFGSFLASQVLSATAQRFQAAKVETMSFTAPSASDLGITTVGVPVAFNLKIRSTRSTSEWSNDYIINSRPLICEIIVSVGDTSTTVGAALATAFAGWEGQFNFSDQGLPFTYSASSGVVTMAMKSANYFLFFQSTIVFKVNNALTPFYVTGVKYVTATGVAGTGSTSATVPVANTVGLRLGDTVAIGTTLTNALTDVGTITAIVTNTSITLDHSITWVTADAIFLLTSAVNPNYDGKYLEENARMSLEDTNGAYSISPDERPLIAGAYTTISFVVTDATVGGIDGVYAKHAFLGSTRGEVGGPRNFKFTLYVLEGTDMFTTGAGHKVYDIINFLKTNLGATTLYIADGSLVASATLFVA